MLLFLVLLIMLVPLFCLVPGCAPAGCLRSLPCSPTHAPGSVALPHLVATLPLPSLPPSP